MSAVELAPIEIAISRDADKYCLSYGSIDVQGTPGDILEACHLAVREVLIAELGSGLLLHAASFRINNQNIVLFADKGAGKTTLSLKILEAGYQVYGDEHVFISKTRIFTRPRTMRVKQSSISFVPALASLVESSPGFENWDGSIIYSVPPETEKVAWELAPFSIDHFIHLSANHGGPTEFSKLSTDQTFQNAMTQCYLPENHQGVGLAALYQAASDAHCWQMNMGNMDQAVGFLKRLTRKD